jgi:hypothetical protein
MNKFPPRADNRTIDLNIEYDARYWTKELGLTREALQIIIDRVGPRLDAIRTHLDSETVDS